MQPSSPVTPDQPAQPTTPTTGPTPPVMPVAVPSSGVTVAPEAAPIPSQISDALSQATTAHPADDSSMSTAPVTQSAVSASKNPLSKLTRLSIFKNMKIVVPVAAVLVILIGLLVFYFGIYTRPNAVYSRFQKNVNKLIDQTANSSFDLVGDMTYGLTVKSQTSDLNLGITSDGRSIASGTDSSTDIKYNGAIFNVGLRAPSDSLNPSTIYFKLSGLGTILNTIYPEGNPLGVSNSALDKYDNKWIKIDLSKYIDTSADTSQDNSLSKAQYQEVWKAFAPVVKKRFFGDGTKTAVYKGINAKSAKVAGKSAWVYEFSYNKQAYIDMLDELKTAVGTTSLTAGQKKTLTDAIQNEKDNTSRSTDAGAADSGNATISSTKIWLEKNTGWPLQLQYVSEQFVDNKTQGRDTTTIGLTSITQQYIKGTIAFTNTSETSSNKGASFNFSIDNNTKKFTLDGDLDLSNKSDSTTKNDKLTLGFSMTKNTNSAPVEKPSSSINFETFLVDIQDITSYIVYSSL